MLSKAEKAVCPPAASDMLQRYLRGDVSAEIALMHLLLATGGLAPLTECLQGLAKGRRAPLVRLVQLASEHHSGLARAAHLVEAGLTEPHGEDRLAAIREQYDSAVATAPEAAVALYSLGDPAILDRATAELVGLLRDWRLLGAGRRALDIGCGIGRIERALAPHLGHIVGIDLSPAMVAEAKRRCAGIANIAFAVTDGRDLQTFADRSFDLVLAIDSFPCLFGASPGIAAQHIGEGGRILRPGGSFIIFNYSYRGDVDADRADVRAHAAAAGLHVVGNGTRHLDLWDGVAFLLRMPLSRG